MSIIVATLFSAKCDTCGWYGYHRQRETLAAEDLQLHEALKHASKSPE